MKANELVHANLYNNFSHLESLQKLLKDASRVRVMCPFISEWGANWLLDNIRPDCKLEVISEIGARGLLSGVQSPEALNRFIEKEAVVYYVTKGLHAKLYWIDDTFLITSANLTQNGLSNNFELGVLLNDQAGFVTSKRSESLREYVTNLWNFLMKSTEKFDSDVYMYFRDIKEKYKDRIDKFKEDQFQIEHEIPTARFFKNNRDILNSDLVNTDLMVNVMFDGFRESDWDVYNQINNELTDLSLQKMKNDLSEQVNPLLRKFYLQLKYEPIFKSVLSDLQEGFSLNRRLKNRFPNDRYIYLTRAKKGKRSNKHIEIPSFIIGFGVDNNMRKWIEVRTGVEEINAGGLTTYGANLLSNIKNNVDEFISRMNSLGSPWALSHGDLNKGEHRFISASELDRNKLIDLINSYVGEEAIADFSIRRKYFLDNEKDRQLMLSSKITSIIAKDFESLIYFFELAHSGID